MSNPQESTVSALEQARDRAARFKKAKCDIEWGSHKKATLVKLLANAEENLKYYTESIPRLKAEIEKHTRNLTALLKLVDENEGAIDDSNKLVEMNKKMERLMKQVAELTAKMEAENARTNSETTQTSSGVCT